MYKFFIVLMFIVTNLFSADVLIITHAFNRPDFIDIQYKTFKKFFLDDYKFVVFNDASNPQIRRQIEMICNYHNIQCIGIPQEIHDRPYLQRWPGEDKNHAAVRHSNGIQYSLNMLGFKHNGLVLMIDSDMFPVKKFSISEFMDGYDLAAVPQSRFNISYLWPGLAFMDMRTLPNKETINWNCGKVDGVPVDTGGHMHIYLKNNPALRVFRFGPMSNSRLICDSCKRNKQYSCTHNDEVLQRHGFDIKTIKFLQSCRHHVEFILDKNFFHCGGMSWDFNCDLNYKEKLVKEYLKDILLN